MDRDLFECRVDNLLNDLKEYIKTHPLSEGEIFVLRDEIDKLLYEYRYYKARLLS